MKLDSIGTYVCKQVKAVGAKITYMALLLYYAYRRKDTPSWAKRIIVGSIAYFLSPIDAIPDLTPFIGFTDDWSVLAFGLVAIACYIDDEVRQLARDKTRQWIGSSDESDFDEVDEML
jgi:uncharacterized membrane protein YkvA (DUF1232 family)